MGGFGVSRVAGLANFIPRDPEFTFNSNGLSGLICVAGCGFDHILWPGFGYYIQNS